MNCHRERQKFHPHAVIWLSLISSLIYWAACQDDFKLTILHTNDVHAHLEESNKFGGTCFEHDRAANKCVGGVARIVTKVNEIRAEDSHAIFMNAGDFFQGTPYYTLLKQDVISAVMSQMGYNYVCLGNHEFDDGPKNLAPFLKKMNESGVTVIGTNTDFLKDPDLKDYNLVKSVVTKINGRKIGILGAVIPATKYGSSPGPHVEFDDEIESFNKELANLKKHDVNIIIAITHSGFSREINIVNKVAEIDILIGGHTNTFLYTGKGYPKENKPDGPYPYVVNRSDESRAVIVQDYWFGKFLGKLQVTFDKDGKIKTYAGNPILLDANVTEDGCMIEVLKPFKEKVAVQMKRNIGATKVCMEHAEDICRLQECNLGNLIADSFFDYYVNRERTDSSAWSTLNGAVVNSGGIRTALPSFSNVTWGDVVTTLPYGNSLVVVTLNGTLLWKMFEHSVFNYTTNEESRRGRFLQVSGFRVEYNLTQPDGCRVVSIRVLCANCSVPKYEPLDWAKTYKIVAQTFVANGGDGFKMLKEANVSDVGPIEYEALEEYIAKMSPIKTPNENRITLIWPPQDEEVVRNVTYRVRQCNESLMQSQ